MKAEKIQEIQILEQNLQSLLLQKQAFQLELNETNSALSALSKSDDDVYKITGSILIKADKESLNKELNDKKKLIELRLKSISNQESQIDKKIDNLKMEKPDKKEI